MYKTIVIKSIIQTINFNLCDSLVHDHLQLLSPLDSLPTNPYHINPVPVMCPALARQCKMKLDG